MLIVDGMEMFRQGRDGAGNDRYLSRKERIDPSMRYLPAFFASGARDGGAGGGSGGGDSILEDGIGIGEEERLGLVKNDVLSRFRSSSSGLGSGQ